MHPAAKGYIPPPDRSLEIFSILHRRLPPEIVFDILNLAQIYHRTYARRLQTMFSGYGMNARSREEKRKVYLQVPVKTVRRVRKLIWVIRMPDLYRNGWTTHLQKRNLKPGDQVSLLQVSLHRRGEAPPEICRSWLSFTVPTSAQTKYVTTWSAPHDFIDLIRKGDTIQLVLPAVFGDDKSNTYLPVGGEIWEAVLFVFTKW